MTNTYDFTSSGEGVYTFATSDTLHYVEESSTASIVVETVTPHSVSLSGTLSLARESVPRIDKRASFVGCDATQQAAITVAAAAAQAYALETQT